MGAFRFKRFSLTQDRSALKIGTDAVLLGASMYLRGDERTMLDAGTGTGVIALMAAQRRSGFDGAFSIVGIDIDGPSVQEAADNFAMSPWAASLSSIHCDLKVYSPETPLDLIFSNPPYYDSSLKNPDGRLAVARHTESLSLPDLFAFSSVHLAASGRLSLIFPSDGEKQALRQAASFGLYPFRVLYFRTTPAKPPRRVVMEFSRVRADCERSVLVVGRDTAAMTEPFYPDSGSKY